MLNRFIYSLNQIFNFVQNPSVHFAHDSSDYKGLRDIAAIIIFLGLTIHTLTKPEDGLSFGLMMGLAVLVTWPLSWLVLNVSAYIFEYYLEWVAYKQILNLQPNLLSTQRIVTYSTVPFIISVIPVEYANYLGGAISILLTSLGLKALYDLKLSLGLGLVLGYQLLGYALVYLIIYALKLLVWTAANNGYNSLL